MNRERIKKLLLYQKYITFLLERELGLLDEPRQPVDENISGQVFTNCNVCGKKLAETEYPMIRASRQEHCPGR